MKRLRAKTHCSSHNSVDGGVKIIILVGNFLVILVSGNAPLQVQSGIRRGGEREQTLAGANGTGVVGMYSPRHLGGGTL